MKKLIILAILYLFTTNSVFCQLNKGETMDKVLAVVGNEVILLSDVRGQLAMMAQQDPRINPDDPKLFQELLDALINEKLLVTKALEDSIVVTDEQIEARWQAFLQTLLQQFGSEERIEQVYKKSINRIRFELRDDIRNKLLSANLVQQLIGNVSITPKEVEEFYIAYKDSIPKVPETYEIYHIVKYVDVKQDERKRIFELARSVRDSILRGGKFKDFAARYSQDLSTAKSGGELGWVTKGRLFPEFENVAYSLEPNEISKPVETPFGYHLIQVIEKRKESINVRHILFKIKQETEDYERTRQFLDTLRKIALEKNNFTELAKQYSDDRDTRGFGGLIGRLPASEIPSNFREQIDKLKDGEISEPLPYNVDKNKPAFHIIWKKSTIPAHIATLEQDYEYISDIALDHKKMKIYNDFIQKLRKELYWEVKR
jgi:peptidyl-prolyl cis-trans isomerase SurA